MSDELLAEDGSQPTILPPARCSARGQLCELKRSAAPNCLPRRGGSRPAPATALGGHRLPAQGLAHAVHRTAAGADHRYVRIVHLAGPRPGTCRSGVGWKPAPARARRPRRRRCSRGPWRQRKGLRADGSSCARSHCSNSCSMTSTHATASPGASMPSCTSRCRKCESKA